jgi:alkane 1-monooxygenase
MFYFAIIHIIYIAVLYNIYESLATIIAVLSGIVGLLLLETINYIGHYDLFRKKLPSTGYERNTNQQS